MRLDFIADPALAERVIVVDSETGEPIENLAWADDETGVYATIKQRPRTMADQPDADLRVKSPNGFALQIHNGAIEFIDRAVNPFKAELLALLDDPEVVAKLRTKEFDWLVLVVAGLLDAVKWHLRGASGTDQRSLDGALQSFRKHFLGEESPSDQDTRDAG